MQNLIKYLMPVVACILSLILGMWIQRQIYIKACLDVGGSQNPAGYPLCIKEVCPDNKTKIENDTTSTPKMVTYYCPDNSVIMVKHNVNPSSPEEIVDVYVKKSNGAELKFKAVHSISASGARYVSEDGIYIYWNKGNECMILKGEDILHKTCISPE